jgi:hypothetical protein
MSPMQFPQIPSGPAGTVAWDPDDHIYRDVGTSSRDGLWPWGHQGPANDQALTPGAWLDVALAGNTLVGPLTMGTYFAWYKGIIQDQSGTSTNHVRLRMCVSDLSSILDESIATPVANGYVTVFGMMTFTLGQSGVVSVKLQAYCTAAARLLGIQLNVPTYAQFLLLHLSNQDIGN